MKNSRTLVFCGAHPDDETFGFGSTLAMYAAQGVKVFCVCSTRGEAGTVAPEYLKVYKNIADLRSAELKCAGEVLGLSGIIYLGYRDSGMQGSEDNKNPESLAMAPTEEVAARIVKIFRDLKPDVVITHDEGGGYGHPDHIATHNAVVKAFKMVADPAQYPEAGPAFQPSKLYFGIMPHKALRILVKLMPLFGGNPHRYGRNKDIDLTKIANEEYPVHAVLKIKNRFNRIRTKAAACHASQGGARPAPFGILRIASKLSGQRDSFMRAYPPPARRRETDLFEGL
jgi:N-acetyl-1-D-myo-inositol-2-amino-2-deoxy-alpha-D-glucopyranoside deacetylase